MQLDHIAIAVSDLDAAIKKYQTILERPVDDIIEVEHEKVRVAFFKLGGVKIELIAATDDSSATAKFLEKRGEGLHHLAFMVDDLTEKMATLEKQGFSSTGDIRGGAVSSKICFLHPKSTCGVLFEFMEA